MNEYINSGVRVRLDTRAIERIAQNPNELAVIREEKRRRDKKVSRTWGAIRLGLCAFCGWFAFDHIDVVIKNGLMVLEIMGVIFAIGFIAATVADFWEKGDERK
jgi:hypothetical protein